MMTTREEMDSLGERLAEYAAHLDAAMHRLLSDLRRFDEGGGWAQQAAQTCAHWLSWRLGMDQNTAREYLRVARRLAELPLLDDALRRGVISYSKVRAITRVASSATEAVLVGMAEHTTANQLELLCRKLGTTQRKPADPNDLADRRYLTRRDLDDGMTQVTARLRPDEATRLFSVLDAIAAERAREVSEEQRVPTEGERAPTDATRDSSAETAATNECGPTGDRSRTAALEAASAPTVRGAAAGSSPARGGSAETVAGKGALVHHVSAEAQVANEGKLARETSGTTPTMVGEPSRGVSAETSAAMEGAFARGCTAETSAAMEGAFARGCSADTPAGMGEGEPVRDVSAETPVAKGGRSRKLRGHRFDRCDALMELVERHARGSQVDRAPIELVVTVSAAALTEDPATDPLDQAGVTSDGTCLSIPTVQRLACDAGVVVVVEDEHGSPLSVGRKYRTVTTALKRALARRDPHCQFPGCTNSVFVESHHIRHWIDGVGRR